MTRPIPQSSIDLVKQFEGCQLTPYRDIGGVYTVGYGHTQGIDANTPPITQERADDLLMQDLTATGQDILNEVTVPLVDNKFAALVSFVFNIGIGHFATSGALKQLNAGNYALVPLHMMLWNHVNGVVVDGLTRRRAAECALYNEPCGTITSA